MKNILKVISIALGLTFVSCGDEFLEKYDPTQLAEGTFFQTEKQFEQAVNGVYDGLQEIIALQFWLTEYISDNTTLHFDPIMRGHAPNYEAIEYWQYVSNTGVITQWYNELYAGLSNINITLDKLKSADIDETAKANFEGQLRFMRAYYYFQLVQCYGDVIIVTEPIASPTEAYTYSRSTVSEVYTFIESDLSSAAAALPATQALAGQATKGAALALLGKVYLTQKKYGDAVTTLNQVKSLGYDILDNYADLWDGAHENSIESIFEVQFQADTDVGEWSGFTYSFYPRDSYGAVIPFPNTSGGGWNVPTLDIMGAYEDGDLRKDASLKEGYTSNEGEWVPVPYVTKYLQPHTILGRPGANWPVLRYADVLLMLAEAINEESGPTTEIYGYVNSLRARAGLSPLSGLDKESFRTAVFKERRIELAFENHRWYDLKRTMSPTELAVFMNAHGEVERANPTTDRGGVPFTPGDYKFEAFEALFPIPEAERLINKNLTQNDGY
nr:RagB/SusD family nutrient uptake outer membrane protein [uncultured Draconibacterium sp.]